MKLLYVNQTNPDARRIGDHVEKYLRARGVDIARSGEGISGEIDMIFAVGGDGTVLRALREYPNIAPVWSVNAGHLGYLTECDPDEVDESLDAVIEGRYRLEMRTVLTGELCGENRRRFFALNEAVLHRGSCTHGMRVKLCVNGAEISNFSGDGILISTPTGSTAYNMSAGGPILLPEADDLAITPVCSHSALRASVVVPGNSRISVEVDRAYRPDDGVLPELVADGIARMSVHPGDTIECTAADWKAVFVRVKQDSFYSRLQRRLVNGGA